MQLQIATQVKVDVARSAVTGIVTEEAGRIRASRSPGRKGRRSSVKREFIHGNQDSRPGIFILVVVVVVHHLGIIGFPTNVQELKDNLHSRIHLGLDLKGGTNLVLQVQVEDAVNITADELSSG